MRPVIKDYLDALTAQPSERMSGRECDRHLFAILEGYHDKGLSREEREHFLNDDVDSLLSRHRTFEMVFAMAQKLADEGEGEPPTEQQRKDNDRILHDIETMAYHITSQIYSQFGYKLNDNTLSWGNLIILRGSDKQTFSDHVRSIIYKEKPETPPKPQSPKADGVKLVNLFKAGVQTKAFDLADAINEAIAEAPKPKRGQGYNKAIARGAHIFRNDNRQYIHCAFQDWAPFLKAIYEGMGLKPSIYSECDV